MSLDFSYTNCDQDLLTDEHYAKTCESVVFRTMFLGMPKITQENWSLFVMRWMKFETAQGYSVYTIKEVAEIVRPWIGLSTNAAPLSDAQFNKKLKEIEESTMRSVRTNWGQEW